MTTKSKTDSSRYKRSFPSEGELDFEFQSKIDLVHLNCPKDPIPLGRLKEYASFIGVRQPYVVSEEGARIFAGGVSTRNLTPKSKPALPLKRFSDVSELVTDLDARDPVIVASSFKTLLTEISIAKKIDKNKGFFVQAMIPPVPEGNNLFSLADVERLAVEASHLREEGYILTKEETSRVIGLAKLAHSVVNDAQALEALRKRKTSASTKHNKFKELALEIKELQEKIATYSPPDYVVALFELLQASIYYTLVSLTQEILTKMTQVDGLDADVLSYIKQGGASWKKFTELLTFQQIKEKFPLTWDSICNPQAPEEGEEYCDPSIIYPTPNLSNPSLIPVTYFVKSIVKEILNFKQK